MIDALDNMLEQLFITTIDEITDPSQVGFDPLDDNWCCYAAALRNGLMAYPSSVRV